MAKRVKLKTKNIIILLIVLILMVIICVLIFKFLPKEEKIIDNKSKAYLGSLEYEIQLFKFEYVEEKLKYEKDITLVRGTEVEVFERDVIQKLGLQTEDESDDEEIKFRKIEYKGKEYLVEPGAIVETYEDSVYEKEKYVRTSTTLYTSFDDVAIAGFAPKGTKLEITGFDSINEDGSVNMYKVKNGESEAYVYSKYLVDTFPLAMAYYNENGVYDIHKGRKYRYELYGGYAANLDYYPYEKEEFVDNLFVDDAKAYYLAGTKYVLAEVDKYIALAKQAGATAFVVDIKDGALAYQSNVAQTYTPTSYAYAMNSTDNYAIAIKKIKDAGFYVIGRIVLFKDSTFAQDNPNDCIVTPPSVKEKWVSAYSRRAWEYNVRLALEAIELFDFNEIQYDYVRFPEASYNWSKNGYNFVNNYNEEKAQAIQNFLFYATDEIHKKNTYISIDVFGECSSTYVTAYGQYWPAISNIVDVVSGMPYTDHFDRNNSAYWTKPYNTLYNWGLTAAARQKEIPTPGKVRTWITAYNVPYWNVTTVYGAEEVYQQVKGLKDAGLGSGFITWNSGSNYSKYQQIAGAFSREY